MLKFAKTCNFKANEERMLTHRTVLGVRDDRVRNKLLEDRMLIGVVPLCRAHESSHLQAKAIMSGTPGVVDRVNQRKTLRLHLHSIRNARNVEGHINHRTCVPPKMQNVTSVLERDIMPHYAWKVC